MKRNLRNRLLSLALTAALCLSLMPVTARAEEDPGYSFNDGTLTVTTNAGTTAWRDDVTIDKLAVTAVVVEQDVTELGASAFRECGNLLSASLPDGLTKIGIHAFSGCGKLSAFRFPNSLSTLGDNAFYKSGLTSTDLSQTKLTAIPDRAFDLSKSLSTVLFPGTLKTIGERAFAYTALDSLDLSGCTDLTTIGLGAFQSTKLPSADLSACTALTTIGRSAFLENFSLSTVTLPARLTTINASAFYSCSSLTAVTFLGDAPTLEYGNAFGNIFTNLAFFVPKDATGYNDGNWANYSDKVVAGAALSGLSVSSGVLEPAFHPGTVNYTMTLPYDAGTVTFTPTAHGSGTITQILGGVEVTGGSPEVSLSPGGLEIVRFTVKNGADDQRHYIIDVSMPDLVPLNLPAISGVTAPARGAVPVAEIVETDQYTGTVAWTPDPGGAFAPGTQYTATVTLTPKLGYTLTGVGENFFTVSGAAATNAADSGTVTAVFPMTDSVPYSGSSYDYYAITPTAGEGGVIAPAKRVSVRKGKSQTFTITPAEGYAIADVLVDGKSVGPVETYTFEKVKARHTIEAVFARKWENPFTDVKEGDWFYGDVAYVHGKGLMIGTGPETFAPDSPVTRATLVTTLWRLAGYPQGGEGGAFTDTPSGQWYSQAVAWAAHTGVTSGVGGGRFDPHTPVSREQMVTILHRFAQYQERDVSVGESTNILSYTDAFAVAEWAVPGFQWACGAGLVEGVGEGRLNPQGELTRAELAALLHRYIEA